VNTLLAPHNLYEQRHLTERLIRTLDNVLGNPLMMPYILYAKWAIDDGRLRFSDLLEHMRFFRGTVEMGAVQRRIHAHTMLWTSHRSNIGINTEAIKALLRNEWNRLEGDVQREYPVSIDALAAFYRAPHHNFNVRIKFVRYGNETRAFWYQNKNMSGLRDFLARQTVDQNVRAAMTSDVNGRRLPLHTGGEE
jgi:hypothetical protein